MPEFPERKHDQLVLSAEVAAGIAANPTEFPNPPFEENQTHEATITVCKRYLLKVF